MDFKQIIRVLIFGLGPSVFDQGSDTWNGIQYLTPYTVAFDAGNETVEDIPQNCHQSDNETLSCSDIWWGVLTLSFIQLPGVCTALFFAFQTLFVDKKYKDLWWSLILLFCPYPLIVWFFHFGSLIKKPDASDESMIAGFVNLEATFESSPQLILQIYIILIDPSRAISLTQKLAIVSAAVTIAKAAIEDFASGDNEEDSMLFEKSFCEKILINVKLSPAFLVSFAFKVKSSCETNLLHFFVCFRPDISQFCAQSFTSIYWFMSVLDYSALL